MTGHEFTPQNDAYPWPLTSVEEQLSRELSVASATFGEIRSYGNTTLPLADTALRGVIDIPDDAAHVPQDALTYLGMAYETGDHPVYNEDHIGVTVTLTSRETYRRYADGRRDPVEPVRLGISMSESLLEPGIAVGITFPTRAFKNVADYPRTDEETSPPRATIRVDSGVSVDKLVESARLRLADALRQPVRNFGFSDKFMGQVIENTKELFEALGVEQLDQDENGQRKGEITLTEPQMEAIRKWVHSYF